MVTFLVLCELGVHQLTTVGEKERPQFLKALVNLASFDFSFWIGDARINPSLLAKRHGFQPPKHFSFELI